MSDSVDSDRVSPKGDSSVHSVEEDNRVKSPTTRRIRVNNNLISSIFSPEPPEPNSPRTIKRCTYHRNLNSHEDIFGQPGELLDHSDVRCRMTQASTSRQNIFGGSGPPVSSIRRIPSVHGNTFDSLFGVPELTLNQRRPYEEDTHCKLFGEPGPVQRLPQQAPPENTQANLFGPPTRYIPHVSSRSEDTQLDLFGPPLPYNRGSARKVVRSGLQLFTDEVAPSKPVVQTRAGKINGASYENLFGPPPRHALVPRLPPAEDTALRLFGPTIQKPLRPVETRYNPITGEEGTDTSSTPTPAPPKPVSTAVSPITGLTLDGSESQPEEKVHRGKRIQPVNMTAVNTITGDRLNYTEGEATQMEEEKEKEEEEEEETTEKVSSQNEESREELRP